jgi:enoyl-CoA hydratase/carnithine racemase
MDAVQLNASHEAIGCFHLEVGADGVAVATFDRPPVNAISIDAYRSLGDLADRAERGSDIRVLILTAPPTARAWCGGADLNDFVGIDAAGRADRYAEINRVLPRFRSVRRPTIAAINGAAIGVGMIAGLCDMRIAADSATFSCPEIDYGLVAGGHGLFASLHLPEAKVREMLFTGARFSARQIEPTGFLNDVVPRDAVLGRAMLLGRQIASKSLPALIARKVASSRIAGRSWEEAYLDAQNLSAELTGSADGAEGVSAFLEGRPAKVQDR